MNGYDKERCINIRKKIFLTALSGGAGHLASAFSCVEILYTLYIKGILRNFTGKSRKAQDRFVLSKGHGALALYAVLNETGVMDDLSLHSYLKPGSRVGGEPRLGDMPGIEASTGSLGHGMGIAVGLALSQKIKQGDDRTYVLVGDGECQEGSIWESAMAAVSHGLDNLTVVLDANGIQKTCAVRNTMKFIAWREKWSAFGWDVTEVDGHEIDDLYNCFRTESSGKKPRLMIANTVKGKGVSIMENNPRWHYHMPTKKELPYFRDELGITEQELEGILRCKVPV